MNQLESAKLKESAISHAMRINEPKYQLQGIGNYNTPEKINLEKVIKEAETIYQWLIKI